MAGLFKDNEHARKVLDSAGVPQDLISDFSVTRGMIPMGYHVYDHQMFVFRTPVTKLADFAGKRTRVLASEGEQAAVASLGAAPVPMSLPEVVPALQQGTIDGVSSVIGVFVPFRYNDAAPEHRRHRPVGADPPPRWSARSGSTPCRPTCRRHVMETGAKLEAPTAPVADQAHRRRHQDLGRPRRQDRQAVAGRTGGRGEAAWLPSLQTVLDKNPPSKELLHQAQGYRGQGELIAPERTPRPPPRLGARRPRRHGQ